LRRITAKVTRSNRRVPGSNSSKDVRVLHVGLMDTDMTEGTDAPKSDPAEVAALAVDAIAAGAFEVLADDVSRGVQAGLAGGVAAPYPQLAN
jgi:hypothetical protein